MRALALALTMVLAAALCAIWGLAWFNRGQPPSASAHEPIVSQPTPEPTSPRTPTSPSPSLRIGEIPDDLLARRLTMPVLGESRGSLTPQFYDARGERGHEALDIIAPLGRPVVAVEDGTIARLFLSDLGGVTLYQFDPAWGYAYYYAHLDRYADGLVEGQRVRRGQVIAYVGMTGNAPVPHLHFAIFRLGADKRWSQGEPVDPYPALTGW